MARGYRADRNARVRVRLGSASEDGAITDVATIVRIAPTDACNTFVCLRLRRRDIRTQTHHGQHATAIAHDVRTDLRGTRVKYFQIIGTRVGKTTNHVALRVVAGIAPAAMTMPSAAR